MLVVDWASTTEINEIPPLGEEVALHLRSYKGRMRQTSYSAWNLLYQALLTNGYPIGVVTFTETGKPFFKDSNISFSLSHSKDICAMAISDRPVGVDVEVIKKSYNPHLIERSLSEKEAAAFDGDFTRIWCRKEAVAKMTGEGITGYPNCIDTTGYEFIERQIESDGNKYWCVAVSS